VDVDHEYVIAKMGVSKVPTLDFNEADVTRIAAQIAEEVGLTPPAAK
jgi:uncharacterized metal-binding protein